MTVPTPDEYLSTIDTYNPNYMGFEDERLIGRQNEAAVVQPPVQKQTAIGITGQNLGLNRVPPVVEGYGQIPANTIPQNITSQLQNLQIQKPKDNFPNMRLQMAGGGGANRIELLLNRLR